MSDSVSDYLQNRGCADFVVRDGLQGLVEAWEYVANSVAAGEVQYQDEYLNDADGRDILAGALQAASEEERAHWTDRVARADAMIRPHLVPTNECLWGAQNALEHGYVREKQWWYYHRPRVVDSTWRSH